jgi:hypothetical protein
MTEDQVELVLMDNNFKVYRKYGQSDLGEVKWVIGSSGQIGAIVKLAEDGSLKISGKNKVDVANAFLAAGRKYGFSVEKGAKK